ncbi:Protein hgv2 [Clonorchis sinensis]|uniref:Protein hgv2 n=1 Tax=Clonorchis sinensis TaxID=79923 RepID=A0A8T1M453_CLOSI|nr:Protein hgv2 [Clonorchis sinensis]
MADELLTHGRRHLVCGEIAQAVESFQKACELIATEHGDLDDKLAEPNFLYGSALLELARMESTVIGNALVGVPEEDSASESDDLVENGPQMTEQEELSNQVLDAMCEPSGDEAADKANGDASTIEGAECAPEDEVEEKASSDEDSEEEVESASNNEEQAETAEDEVDADTQEDISNLQLAWEVLEVSKTIYSRKNDDESRLKVADCLEKLAEISREKEDYVQALSDLQDCLTIRSAVLNDDHRDIAEVHYQLGTTHAIAGALDLASTCFRNAVSCLQQHANNIRTKITEMEKLDDQAVELEALRNSLKEVESLVSDVQRRHAEVNEDLAATQLGIQSNSSTLAVKSTESDTNAQVVDDISHLVRKKRAVSDETAGEPTVSEIIPAPSETQKLKKARITADNPATNGDVGHLNGTSQATLTNGTQDNPIAEVV